MNNKIAGCYYHPNRLSVAVCSECGHGLCRDCIYHGDSGQTLCIDCANKELKQKHKEYRKFLRESGGRFRSGKDFLVPGIIGIVLCIAVALLVIADGQSFFLTEEEGLLQSISGIIAFVFLEYNVFAIPFCICRLRDIFPPRYSKYNKGIEVLVLKLAFYVMVSSFTSWLFLSFYLVRFFTVPKRNE